jgi:hypothetical protein
MNYTKQTKKQIKEAAAQEGLNISIRTKKEEMIKRLIAHKAKTAVKARAHVPSNFFARLRNFFNL